MNSVDRDMLDRLLAQAAEQQRAGHHAAAEQSLLQLTAHLPNWADLHNNLGCVQQALGKLDMAEQSYARAVQLQPANAVARNNLGCLLNERRRFDQAIEQFQILTQLKPDDAKAMCNLGCALLCGGRADDAVASLRRAIGIDPLFALAHNNLGNALAAVGKRDDAIASYQRAILLNPADASAHNNLACVFLDQNDIDQAVALLQKAIAIDSKYADAYCNLAVAFKSRDQLEEARQCFDQALSLDPQHADAISNLASLLQDQGKLDEAMALCDRAIALQPALAAAHCNRGSILKDLGRLTEAQIAFRHAISLRPAYAEAHYNLAQLKKFAAGDADLVALRSLVDRSEMTPPRKRPYVHFALAKALEDAGEYTGSFDQLIAGNRLKRQQLQYNVQADLDFFGEIQRVYSADLFRRTAGTGDPSAQVIFVLGMPRSGSTLVEQILSSHPMIFGGGELTALSIAARDSFLSPDEMRLREMQDAYLKLLPPIPAGKTRITDKMPGNFVYIGLIHLMLPGARIIHTVRDPIDTCISCFSKLFLHGSPFSYDLGELGQYYRGYVELMEHWKAVLPTGRIFDLSYEKLVEDPEGEAKKLIAHCGLPWDEACLRFEENRRAVLTASSVQVRQPVYRSSVRRGQRYGGWIGELVGALGREGSGLEKSEIRNQKSEGNPNDQIRNERRAVIDAPSGSERFLIGQFHEPRRWTTNILSDFVIRISFGFLVSDFGFSKPGLVSHFGFFITVCLLEFESFFPEHAMAETIIVACPKCGAKYQVTSAQLGQMFQCSQCQTPFAASVDAAGAPPMAQPLGYANMTSDTTKTSGMAIASLVCGVAFCVPLAGVAALILGIIGITQTGPGKKRGRGLAIAGTILGGLSLLILPALLLPSLNRAREVANRAKCASNLHQIGLAMLLYQNDNMQQYPPDLTTLATAEQNTISLGVFVCPASNDTAATSPSQLETGGHLSYKYIYPGHVYGMLNATDVVMYEDTKDHHDGTNILFADGHVEYCKNGLAQQYINATLAHAQH